MNIIASRVCAARREMITKEYGKCSEYVAFLVVSLVTENKIKMKKIEFNVPIACE